MTQSHCTKSNWFFLNVVSPSDESINGAAIGVGTGFAVIVFTLGVTSVFVFMHRKHRMFKKRGTDIRLFNSHYLYNVYNLITVAYFVYKYVFLVCSVPSAYVFCLLFIELWVWDLNNGKLQLTILGQNTMQYFFLNQQMFLQNHWAHQYIVKNTRNVFNIIVNNIFFFFFFRRHQQHCIWINICWAKVNKCWFFSLRIHECFW